MGGAKEFVANSHGHCFLCLSKIAAVQCLGSDDEEDPEGGPGPTTTIYSLKSLSRHLKMDLVKVLKLNGWEQGTATSESSELKVELCEECSCVTDKFSGLYRQMVGIKLKITSVLKVIQGRLAGAKQAKRMRKLRGSMKKAGTGAITNRNIKIVEALRMEALEKCSLELNDAPPAPPPPGKKVDKQTMTDEELAVGNPEASSCNEPTQQDCNSGFLDPMIETGEVKIECHAAVSNSSDELVERDAYLWDLQRQSGSSMEPPPKDADAEPVENLKIISVTSVRQEVNENLGTEGLNHPTPSSAFGGDAGQVEVVTKKTSPSNLASSSHSQKKGALPQRRWTPGTSAKHRCNFCGRKFAKYYNLFSHQREFHSGTVGAVKDQNPKLCVCNICGKGFTNAFSLKRHLERFPPPSCLPSAPKVSHKKSIGKYPPPIFNPQTGNYKCNFCPRKYSQVKAYQEHYKSAHLNLRYRCKLCGKEFVAKKGRERHYQNVHLGIRYECEKCNYPFTAKFSLDSHQKNIVCVPPSS